MSNMPVEPFSPFDFFAISIGETGSSLPRSGAPSYTLGIGESTVHYGDWQFHKISKIGSPHIASLSDYIFRISQAYSFHELDECPPLAKDSWAH